MSRLFTMIIVSTPIILAATLGQSAAAQAPGENVAGADSAFLRGVYFNPLIEGSTNYPWLLSYPTYRRQITAALQDMVREATLNLAAIFLSMPNSLATPKQAPAPGQPLAEWANVTYLDNVALFIDDCHAAGVSVALDMANNMWIPYSVDAGTRLVGVPDDPPGTDPWWPVADDTPWDESVTWYTEIIEYVEGKTNHPESIAWWCMGGNHALGGAETALWDNDGVPDMKVYNELFVKNVWPAFKTAGTRPKAAPYLLPIFSSTSYWMDREDARLSAFTNLKEWIVDDLGLPPDYWPVTLYPLCDPAPNGHFYLREIVDILGHENAHRIVPTDLGVLADHSGIILSTEGHTDAEQFGWLFEKFREYGFPAWWTWCYQDGPGESRGLRRENGTWKKELLDVISKQAFELAPRMPAVGVWGLGLLTAAATVGGGVLLCHP